MFDKIAKIVAKLNGTVWMAVAVGIVAVVFVIGLIMSLGGEVSKFKKVAAHVIKDPSSANAQAKHLPIRARKQYKAYRQAGGKPDDSITPDACVYAPFKESAAARFPAAVMTAGILSILLSFFIATCVKDAEKIGNVYLIPAVVTVAVMVLRLLAGLISSALVKSGVATYYKYVAALGKNAGGEHEEQPAPAQTFATQEEPQPAAAYGNTFDQPSHITVELEEEPTPVYVQEEPAPEPQTVIMPEPQESEEEIRARARAQAMERARAEQAAAQAAAQAQAAQATQAQPQPQPAPAAQPQPAAGGSSSADEVIARIEKIKQEGGTLPQMKEVALALQKERAKPENKTPEMQRKLNEALAALLKSMSGANRK